MVIGIEGQRLFRKKKHGMDIVALELIKNLQKLDKKNQYIVFVKPDEDNTCIPKADNFIIVELDGGAYPLWEQVALPKAAKEHGCEILHCTSNTGPIRCDIPVILILHDIIYLESISILKKDGTWYQKFGNLYRRLIVPIIARKSSRVITVSNYEKDRIQNYFKYSDGRLRTIYNGVGNHFKKITDSDYLNLISERYNLPDNFVFFLGNTDPKKNTKGVLKAFAEFNTNSKLKYHLVMLDYNEQELQKLLSEIKHPEIREYIHLTGYVPNEELPAIINQCKVFLYPSIRESFGIPTLEGMACGVPVITSNTSSMPEIAGDAACIVDPHNTAEITAAINRILSDKTYAEELCQKGISQAKKFSWEIMAKENLQLYHEVFNELNN